MHNHSLIDLFFYLSKKSNKKGALNKIVSKKFECQQKQLIIISIVLYLSFNSVPKPGPHLTLIFAKVSATTYALPTTTATNTSKLLNFEIKNN
jgi:hypothetical protein